MSFNYVRVMNSICKTFFLNNNPVKKRKLIKMKNFQFSVKEITNKVIMNNMKNNRKELMTIPKDLIIVLSQNKALKNLRSLDSTLN